MMLKKITAIVIVLSLVSSGGVYAEEGKKDIFDIIKAPIKMILAPVKGGGLVDIVTSPAEMMLSPITELGEIVITPGRTEEYVFNINKNISVITSEEIEEAQYKTVQQIISKEAGVSVNGFLNNAKDNSIDMRGFGEAGLSNFVVLINGRRTNQIDLSGADLSLK
ncbi:MAG: TonB-dependent receptor plug domain-containing protein [Candidatus Omnitrophota bacterium]